MEWNYLWVKHEEYRNRILDAEEKALHPEDISPPLPDSIRFTVVGFTLGILIAAGITVSRGPDAPPLWIPGGQAPANPGLTLKPADASHTSRAPASNPAESAGGGENGEIQKRTIAIPNQPHLKPDP